MTTTTSSSRNPIKGERLFDRTFARLLAAREGDKRGLP